MTRFNNLFLILRTRDRLKRLVRPSFIHYANRERSKRVSEGLQSRLDKFTYTTITTERLREAEAIFVVLQGGGKAPSHNPDDLDSNSGLILRTYIDV